MTEQEFSNSTILQNCGDSLKIIEKIVVMNIFGNVNFNKIYDCGQLVFSWYV